MLHISISDDWLQRVQAVVSRITPGSNEYGSISHCERFVFLSRAMDYTTLPSNDRAGPHAAPRFH